MEKIRLEDAQGGLWECMWDISPKRKFQGFKKTRFKKKKIVKYFSFSSSIIELRKKQNLGLEKNKLVSP
jgi:hypothetical protein